MFKEEMIFLVVSWNLWGIQLSRRSIKLINIYISINTVLLNFLFIEELHTKSEY